MDDRRVIVFDVETTGTDKRRDQVIELCVQIGLEGGSSQTWRIKPSVPISPGAQAVHGITMEDLEVCPLFGQVAGAIRAMIDRAEVLVGYNLAFDIEMLQAEFARLGQPPLDLTGKQVIDPFRLWQQCEPRSLQDAHKRFVGEGFSAAHSATADVAATGRVLRGMLHHFQLSDDWGEIARVCEPEREAWVGSSRHLRWDEGGRLVIGFGKHAGVPVVELAKGPDATYLMWIANKDFPHHVREICGRALETDGAALEAWVKSVYGMPAAEDPAAPEEIGRADTAPIDGSMPDIGPAEPAIEPAIERGSDSAREPRPQPVQLGLAI
jgi:DNA polymerase III subunit epsilon